MPSLGLSFLLCTMGLLPGLLRRFNETTYKKAFAHGRCLTVCWSVGMASSGCVSPD